MNNNSTTKLQTKPIWNVICNIVKCNNIEHDENNKFVRAALRELAQPHVLNFDAAISVPFFGVINEPLSLQIHDEIKPICYERGDISTHYRVGEDFVYNVWSLINKVRDEFDAETAINFMISDFSDEDGGINAGSSEQPDLTEQYGDAAGYAEQVTRLFESKKIAYWAISANSYDSLTYVTALYRRDWGNPYSAQELTFIHAFLPFLSRIYAFSASGVWIAILSNDLTLTILWNNEVASWSVYYRFLLDGVKTDEKLIYYLQHGSVNNKIHRYIDDDITFEIMKLKLPMDHSLPFCAVIGCYNVNYNSFAPTWNS